jgi:cell division septum initiation protein DivIVA
LYSIFVTQNGDLRKQLASLQQELEEAVFTRDSALAQEAASREECSQQVQMANEVIVYLLRHYTVAKQVQMACVIQDVFKLVF